MFEVATVQVHLLECIMCTARDWIVLTHMKLRTLLQLGVQQGSFDQPKYSHRFTDQFRNVSKCVVADFACSSKLIASFIDHLKFAL